MMAEVNIWMIVSLTAVFIHEQETIWIFFLIL